MTRVSLLLAGFLLAGSPLFGQFGKLTRVLDKAKSISDLQITDEDERALGEAISQRIRAAYGVQQDPEATRYVTLVGRVIAEKTSRPNLDWQFIILDSDSTNAFAAPGGFIHITRGALAIMESEAELAGVLAHEIGHVTEKHTIKGIQKMKGIELADGQTSLTGNSQVFQAIADKATEAILQGFGRSEELEADEVGLELAADCRYSPHGLSGFLNALQSRYSERKSRAGLFASHPETKERLERLDRTIKKQKLDQQASIALDDRFNRHIQYELAAFVGTGAGVEGARGMAQGESSQKDEEEEKEEKEEKKSGGGLLGKMKNPFGSGQKEQRAEVTGSAAARGVETEVGIEEPGNPAVVVVQVGPADIQAFKEEGGLA